MCISTHYILHSDKVSGNSGEWFQRSCPDKLFQLYLSFWSKSKFKKGEIFHKKIESKIPVDMHIYTLCPSLLQSFRQFCGAVSKELRWQTVLNSIFHFGQFFKFKKGVTRRKNWIKISCDMHIYMVCPLQLQSFMKFCWVVSEELRWQTVSVESFILAKFIISKRA